MENIQIHKQQKGGNFYKKLFRKLKEVDPNLIEIKQVFIKDNQIVGSLYTGQDKKEFLSGKSTDIDELIVFK
jgi:hypothetical protein